MNAYYRQIIDDFVIPTHTFNIKSKDMALIVKVFERFGSKIGRLHLRIHCDDDDSIEELFNLFSRFCLIDQLREVSIDTKSKIFAIVLPAHFQRVKRFHFSGYKEGLISTHLASMPLSETLRYLR